MVTGPVWTTVESTIDAVANGIVVAAPRLLAAILLVAIAAAGISLALWILQRALDRVLPDDQHLVGRLVVVFVGIVLWFGVALAVLGVLGLEEIAASVGTAVGFLALGVSYALSDMIEDTVAGVYLLRDRDFEIGDRVRTADRTGEVLAIGLRKTRLRVADGETTVLANRTVEREWTREGEDRP